MESLSTTPVEPRRQLVASVWSFVVARADLVWLAAITLVGAYCRLCFLNAPIRYDEAFTFLTFVKGGVTQLFEYPFPNNHILHTLLVRATTDLFGRTLPMIRLVSFAFGVAAIPLTFALCRRIGSRSSGYLAATGVTALPYLVLYSAIARGYSLIVVFSLCTALLGHKLVQQLNFRRCALLALVSAFGMLTMPSMVFALAGTGIWIAGLLLSSQRRLSVVAAYLGVYAALTVALTVAFYIPTLIVSGAGAVLSNRFVAPLPWHEFFRRLGPHLRETTADFARDVPLPVLLGCAALTLVGFVAAILARNWAAVTLLPALFLGGAAVLVLKHSIPYARTWIYLLPFILVIADLGLEPVLQRMAAGYRAIIPLLLLVAGVLACKHTVADEVIVRYPDVGNFPEASALVERLRPILHRGEPVHLWSVGSYPLRFYLWYHGVPERQRKPRRPRQEFFVVRKGIDRVPDGDAKLVLEHANLELYQRAQQPKPKK